MMKKLIKNTVLFITLIIIGIFQISCSEVSVEYRVRVVSVTANFKGYCFYDDSGVQSLVGGATTPAGTFAVDYTFEDPEEEIRVYAITDDASATKLDIFLYKDGSKIKEAAGIRTGGDTNYPFEASIQHTIVSSDGNSNTTSE